jgi:hypothetical protein
MEYFAWPMLAIAFLDFDCMVCVHRICAYLDPGTGSFIIQILIAGLLGSLFAIKIFFNTIKDFFKNLFSKGKRIWKR